MKEQFAALSEEQRSQIIDLTASAADAEAAYEALTAAGYEMSKETAAYLFTQVNTPPVGELSDEELENVAGGCGCGDCGNQIVDGQGSDAPPSI